MRSLFAIFGHVSRLLVFPVLSSKSATAGSAGGGDTRCHLRRTRSVLVGPARGNPRAMWQPAAKGAAVMRSGSNIHAAGKAGKGCRDRIFCTVESPATYSWYVPCCRFSAFATPHHCPRFPVAIVNYSLTAAGTHARPLAGSRSGDREGQAAAVDQVRE